VIARDPNRYYDHWRLGEWLADEYAVTHNPDTLNAAVAAFDRAIALYPHNALLLAQYAERLQNANRPSAAKDIAKRAIAQDDINRAAGHLDKVLDDKVRNNLEAIRDGRAATTKQTPKTN